MSDYAIVVTKEAQKDIAKLDSVVRKRLQKKLQFFIQSGEPLAFATQLVNVQPPTYRFRIGKHRIFFDTKGKTIRILAIERRDEAYR